MTRLDYNFFANDKYFALATSSLSSSCSSQPNDYCPFLTIERTWQWTTNWHSRIKLHFSNARHEKWQSIFDDFTSGLCIWIFIKSFACRTWKSHFPSHTFFKSESNFSMPHCLLWHVFIIIFHRFERLRTRILWVCAGENLILKVESEKGETWYRNAAMQKF